MDNKNILAVRNVCPIFSPFPTISVKVCCILLGAAVLSKRLAVNFKT